jgi:F-type H+-transporting ATPase subunit b
MEILRQLAELLQQAAPVFLLVLVFFLFLRGQLFRPLEKVLMERQARTGGFRRAAEAAQTAAQEKARAYQEALHKARADAYAEQEAIRRSALEARAGLIRDARNRATNEVRQAKERIAGEMAGAQAQLEKEEQALGQAIARAILEKGVQ